MHIKTIITILILCFSLQVIAQRSSIGTKSQLAYNYFKDKEYSKAALLYKELHQQSKTEVYLNYLIKCYLANEQYDVAEKELKRQIKTHRFNPALKVQLGSVYLASGDDLKAEKIFQKSIAQLKGDNRTQVITLANAFVSQRKFKYAEETFLKGRKLSKGEYSYASELANIYYYSRDYTKMIEQYLSMLEESPGYLGTVQNRLQATVYAQDDGSLNRTLKLQLIDKIQKSKQSSVFSELLIWLYIQEKEFGKAFIQTKALDKRNHEGGVRLVSLGELAFSNKDFDAAFECYQYVLSLGEQSPYFFKAKVGYLESLQAQVINSETRQKENISNLIVAYETVIAEIGERPESIDILINYAHILSFYGGNVPKGIEVLENLLAHRVLNHKQNSYAKIELADELLLDNKIWEATLYYSQAIKANPNNDIGNEAQIKKAKLSYYSGDFLWAKAQLDVLKASTTKLIANNALYLSTLISDNLEDSINEPMQMFSQADLLIFQNKKHQAIEMLDSIDSKYPRHSLSDDILYKKAQILESLGQNAKAKELYQKIVDKFYHDILADNAIMALANLYYLEGNQEKAMELYTQLLVDFSDSFFTAEARRKIVEYRDS